MFHSYFALSNFLIPFLTMTGIANAIKIFFRPNLFVMNPNKKLPNKAPDKKDKTDFISIEFK